MRVVEPSSEGPKERIDEVEVKIEELEWKAELRKIRAQI